jgi:hypothetical protein
MPAPVFELIDGNFILPPPADLEKSFFVIAHLSSYRFSGSKFCSINITTSATSSASIIKLIRPARWRSLARRERSALVRSMRSDSAMVNYLLDLK